MSYTYLAEHLKNAGFNPSLHWRCVIEQTNYDYLRHAAIIWVSFQPYDYSHWVKHKPMLLSSVALFRVRRKILHGYTVRDCTICSWYENRSDTATIQSMVVEQVRHNAEKHLTNYAFTVDYWEHVHRGNDTHTIAIFRVKRKGVNNG